MVDCVKGREQVEANQHSDLLVIGRCETLSRTCQQSSLGGMPLPVCRLELAEVARAEQMRPQQSREWATQSDP